MQVEHIRNDRNQLIAIQETANNRTNIYNSRQQLLGHYDHKVNRTYDRSGRDIGSGNQLMRLL